VTRPWRVPRLWPNETCYILGGGPSLNLVDLDRLGAHPGRRVIAVNCAYRVAPWADVCFYGDCTWLKANREMFRLFAGLKVTTCAGHENEPGIHVLVKKTGPKGILWDPATVAWNVSSGACAINLAVHFGVNRIILFGFDMHASPEGDNNFHHWYPPSNSQQNPYRRFLQAFDRIAADLADHEIKIINACPGSAIHQWPIVSPDDLGFGFGEGAPENRFWGSEDDPEDPRQRVNAGPYCARAALPAPASGKAPQRAPGAISPPEARGVRGRLAPAPIPGRSRVPRGTKILGVRDSERQEDRTCEVKR